MVSTHFDGAMTMQALEQYMQTFAGYGDSSAPVWFVGMEEGGGESVAELSRRVQAWDERGRAIFEDLASYHREIGVTNFFDGERPVLQKTWCPLIKCLQAYRGAPTDDATIRSVQATELGAHGGPASLLELMPLPAANVSAWPYASLAATIPALATRKSYEETFTSQRVGMLRALRRQHKPRAVVFYGVGYRPHWESISVTALASRTIGSVRYFEGSRDSTHFIVAPHPSRMNATAFWTTLGESIAARSDR
jgi:hypothetical protein